MNIQNYRGSQEWNKLDASDYIQLPDTPKYMSGMSLQRAAQRCQTRMVELIRIHNERAGAHNRALQSQQQNDVCALEEEEEGSVAEKAEWTSTIVAVKAKHARDAKEQLQSRNGVVGEKINRIAVHCPGNPHEGIDQGNNYGGTLHIPDSENTADAVSSASKSQHTIFQNLISLDILLSLELASVACSQQNLSPCQ
ncbi:uncharacterized protein Bfra_000750 [Botrytis fragariae]|uniref:Uncharacterized protein n=1 Tax=Botrytis fragariae TaxID=1964551 RepID=A0A8H6ENE8_9HELO|nr:uncharacterized protein Bfra_000750 [Botrytis fragariae]KAF5878583.1 hypothetical protein Bfra_000750 [Botrytis fragariae]